MTTNPGDIFNYNSGASHLLSAVLQSATGNSTLEFAITYLFNPLGIKDVLWGQDPQGIYFGGSNLRLTPRDLAKIGFLYLNNGKWNNSQIISKEWIRESIDTHIPYYDSWFYGYQWYYNQDLGMIAAVGWGGQRMYLLPKDNLIIIFTADLGESETPYRILLYDYILPSVGSDTSNSFITSTSALSPQFIVLSLLLNITGIVLVIKRFNLVKKNIFKN